jgi:hypothetical protein
MLATQDCAALHAQNHRMHPDSNITTGLEASPKGVPLPIRFAGRIFSSGQNYCASQPPIRLEWLNATKGTLLTVR